MRLALDQGLKIESIRSSCLALPPKNSEQAEHSEHLAVFGRARVFRLYMGKSERPCNLAGKCITTP